MRDASELTVLIRDIKERVLYLQELGVESFDVKLSERTVLPPASAKPVHADILEKAAFPAKTFAKSPGPPATRTVTDSRLSQLPSLSKREVQPAPRSHTSTLGGEGTAISDDPFGDTPQSLAPATETIENIRAEIGDCVRCPLAAGRTRIVHSTGNFHADLMFVGEAPGADEDEQGLPFVGRAGKLLTDIIAAIGFSREDVFIGNINRCRPPGNRQPVPIETETCRPFLLREVAVVRPKVIVVLGNTATQNLLGVKTPISKLRGNFQDYFGVKVMPTFHPAYLLRDPHKKRDVWEDMKKVRDFLKSA